MGPLYFPSSGLIICNSGPTQTSVSSYDWFNLTLLADTNDNTFAYSSNIATNTVTETITTVFSYSFLSTIDTTITSIFINIKANIPTNMGSTVHLYQSQFVSGGITVNGNSFSVCCNTSIFTFNISPNTIPWNVTNIISGFQFKFNVTQTGGTTSRSASVYYVKSNIVYNIDTKLIGVTPSSKFGYYGNGTLLTITGQNFFNNFTVAANPIRVRIGSVVLTTGITIVNSNTISAILPNGTLFTAGANNVAVSLNAGTTWTNDSITFTFNQACPGFDNCNGHGVCVGGSCQSCDPGWSTTGNGCITLSPTACGNTTNPCNNGTCVGSGLCQCNSGYKGVVCNVVSCPNDCSNHGSCDAPNLCSCFSGWNGSDCSSAICSDVVNCVPGTCYAPNSCSCTSGYSGPSCNIPVCDVFVCVNGYCSGPNQCTCDIGYAGPTCNQFDCSLQNNCTGNGACTGAGVCSCNQGYSGATCNTNDCSIVGNCVVNGVSRGTCNGPNICKCNPGYTGPNCQFFDCSPQNCSSKGTCTGPNVCTCNSGYSGPSCSSFDCSLVNNCGNGICSGPNNCTCNNGYFGSSCGYFLTQFFFYFKKKI